MGMRTLGDPEEDGAGPEKGRAVPEEDGRRLASQVSRDVERMKKAEREKHDVLSSWLSLGTIGLLFILPVVVGAFLGRWLDQHLAGYAIHWTITGILLGVILGAISVYNHLRQNL
ncbi:ATP synthase protein I [Methylacidimicrobium tartarophylax]|uniref:ATP synthase protein I n=2 Tax=Methylacidimicrobium tartarophylax TaxID=1041768 RepID=A0A5E6M956_9BACT|nr:ATP synthase protein I [Methylacidimicrobium tartarophylax]